MNSKKIYVRRRETMGHLPKEIRAGAKIRVGSIFVNRLPLKGVEGEEEAKLLRPILNVPPTHQDWPQKAHDFWASLSLLVPFEGRELEIGLREDGSPVNSMDYIYWRWLQRHKHVAETEMQMLDNADKRFYIYDPEREKVKRNELVKFKKEADKEFLKLEGDYSRMRKLLRVCVPGTNPDKMMDMDVENALYEEKEKRPKIFLRYATDENLDVQAEIEEMVEEGILRRIGNQVIFGDETVGQDIKDTIVYFKNRRNSGQINVMRARLREITGKFSAETVDAVTAGPAETDKDEE